MSNPSSLENIAKWLEEHQDKETKVVLTSSTRDNIYSFEAAFNLFVLEGDIDLSTNEIANGTLYTTVPVWGRINLKEDIAGNLGNSVTCQLPHEHNFHGHFTLSLDKKSKKLIIDYEMGLRFVGHVHNKVALFPIPASASTTAAQSIPRKPSGFTMGTEDYKLFDKFLEDRYGNDGHNFTVITYSPRGPDVPRGSKELTFNVGFIGGVFELEGAIDPETFRLVANLYTRVPLWGRVLITPVSGNLKESIQLSVNTILASGSVDLRLFGKNVGSIVDLDVKFVGKIRDDFQLLTLPF